MHGFVLIFLLFHLYACPTFFSTDWSRLSIQGILKTVVLSVNETIIVFSGFIPIVSSTAADLAWDLVSDTATNRTNQSQPRYTSPHHTFRRTEVNMLVLSRYRDESIYIGDDVIVTVVDIRGDRVRLGIQAPPNVSVHRQEIYDAIVEGKDAPPGGTKRTLEPKAPEKKENSSSAVRKLPLEGKLAARKSKGLPIDLDDSSIGFGGLTEMIK